MSTSDSSGNREGAVSGPLRRIASGLAAMLATRAELATTELDELAVRYRELVVLAVAAVVLLGFALMVLTLLVVVAFWDTYRIPAIVVLMLAYALPGAWVALLARRRAGELPRPFSATLDELHRDVATLRGSPRRQAP